MDSRHRGNSSQAVAILQAGRIERTGTGMMQHLRVLLESAEPKSLHRSLAHHDWNRALLPSVPTDRPGWQLSTPRRQIPAQGAKTLWAGVCAYAHAWKAEKAAVCRSVCVARLVVFLKVAFRSGRVASVPFSGRCVHPGTSGAGHRDDFPVHLDERPQIGGGNHLVTCVEARGPYCQVCSRRGGALCVAVGFGQHLFV